VTKSAYNIRPNGLGIIITQLSFLLAMNRPVIAVVANQDNLVYDFKRIFQIPDSMLTIEQGTHGYPDLETDELCTYAPYFGSPGVQLFGQTYSTARKKKSCVALAMHHNAGLVDPFGHYGMPYNKFATAEEYNLLFEKLTKLGYDVITMNQTGQTLEQKIYMLNELCDFVIGYEGGVGHLAHVLGIPYVCLPWRLNDMGHPGIQPGLWYEAHRFHPDRRTWFLQDVAEFANWNQQQLHNMIDQLYNNGGNNILFDADTYMNPNTLEIKNKNGRDLTPRVMWAEDRGARTTAFIKEHLPVECMQKYPTKSTTYTT
jgi:hypothetical protein